MQTKKEPDFLPINRRQLLGSLVAAGTVGVTGHAIAQTAFKPRSIVKLIVPWPAGGPTDIVGRLIAQALSERGVQAIVENKPGATGSLGAEFVFRAAPDGTTLLVGTSDTISIFPQVSKNARFQPKEFVPIIGLGGIPLYLIGRADLPARNLQELIALAKHQNLSFANSGMGGTLHLATVEFGRTAKIDNMTHVPFQGAVPAVQAILGKQVDLALTTGSLTLPNRENVKVFGGSSLNRMSALKDTPTFTEQGLAMELVSWSGVLAPPGTPAGTADALSRMIAEIIATPSYQTKLSELIMTSYTMSRPEFAQFLDREYNRWGDLIKTANVKLDA